MLRPANRTVVPSVGGAAWAVVCNAQSRMSQMRCSPPYVSLWKRMQNLVMSCCNIHCGITIAVHSLLPPEHPVLTSSSVRRSNVTVCCLLNFKHEFSTEYSKLDRDPVVEETDWTVILWSLVWHELCMTFALDLQHIEMFHRLVHGRDELYEFIAISHP